MQADEKMANSNMHTINVGGKHCAKCLYAAQLTVFFVTCSFIIPCVFVFYGPFVVLNALYFILWGSV